MQKISLYIVFGLFNRENAKGLQSDTFNEKMEIHLAKGFRIDKRAPNSQFYL